MEKLSKVYETDVFTGVDEEDLCTIIEDLTNEKSQVLKEKEGINEQLKHIIKTCLTLKNENEVLKQVVFYFQQKFTDNSKRRRESDL